MQTNDDKTTDQSANQTSSERRLTVPEAAAVLDISPEAVRARIHRGTLVKEKGKDGTVYVRLNGDQTQSNTDRTRDQTTDYSQTNDDETTDQSHQVDAPLVEALKERVEHLSEILATRDEEIRRRDTIIMTMAQRIPELEAPASQEPRDTPETTSEHRTGADTPNDSQEPIQRRSWWRTFFGFTE